MRTAIVMLALLGLASLSATPAWSLTHAVGKGETLTEIAEAYGLSVEAIIRANDLKNANRLSIGQELEIPSGEELFFNYKVRRGDSLSTIAARYGISATALAHFNGIRNANRISVGETLRIPAGVGYAGSSRHPKLPSSIKAQLDRIPVDKRTWKYIVIHHSATPFDRARNIDRVHREDRHMENGLAYHFVIENGTRGTKSGDTFIGDRWKEQIHGGHLRSYQLNEIAIGICLIGNFEVSRPSSEQMEQLEALVAYLIERADIKPENITSHTLIHRNHTVCPGKHFPLQSFLAKFN